jgi:hypothetical protein
VRVLGLVRVAIFLRQRLGCSQLHNRMMLWRNYETAVILLMAMAKETVSDVVCLTLRFPLCPKILSFINWMEKVGWCARQDSNLRPFDS